MEALREGDPLSARVAEQIAPGVDAFDISDLAALRTLLESTQTTKVIHNAAFEREVLGRHGLTINAVSRSIATMGVRSSGHERRDPR